MTFWKWLYAQRKRDDAVGDVARDVLQDARTDPSGFPRARTSVNLRVRMLDHTYEGSPAMQAFEKAVLEWIRNDAACPCGSRESLAYWFTSDGDDEGVCSAEGVTCESCIRKAVGEWKAGLA